MADYTFARLSVLIADNNARMRDMLQAVLRSLGVGNIVAVRAGDEAVRRLCRVNGPAPATGPLALDLVIAEQTMPTLDGLSLLRWLRGHRDSPNRFMPVILTGAGAGPDDVARARDAGVHAFIAKPFTGARLIEHLLSIVERPRPFIYCADYFGPDRRGGADAATRERRHMQDSDIRVVLGDKAPPPLSSHGHAVWRFQPPNRLRDKLLTGDPATPPALPAALQQEAEQAIARASDDYAEEVEDAIVELKRHLAACRATADAAALHYARMLPIARTLAGQGSLFGFPLIGEFGRLLLDYLRVPEQAGPRHFALIAAHVDAIAAVAHRRILGDGGATGHAIVAGLKRARRRIDAAA